MNDCSLDIAHRVLEGIEVDGSISRLAVPVSSLAPAGVRFWARCVLGDPELAERLERTAAHRYSGVLAERRAQCERLIFGNGSRSRRRLRRG